MEKLIQLIYVSSAIKPFTDLELNSLLLGAREANKKHNITGLLLYKDGNFIQAVEGKEPDVERLHLNIAADYSHTGMIVLIKESIQQRAFPGWAMGFKNLSSGNIEGFSDFLLASAEDTLLPGKAKTLPMSFKNT